MKVNLPAPVRGLVKRFLRVSRAKLIYSKITLSRYTSLYFAFTLLFCLILSALQGVLYSDNAQAVGILRNTVESANLPPHIAFIIKEEGDLKLQVCDGTPGNTDTSCEVVANLSTARNATQRRALSRRTFRRTKRSLRKRQEPKEEEEDSSSDEEDGAESSDDEDGAESSEDEGGADSSDEEEDEEDEEDEKDEGEKPQPTQNSSTTGNGTVFENSSVRLTANCVHALSWLENTLHDSEREDIAILFYQFWMFTLGFVTVVNESLPHLGAGILAHVLGGAWSASRVKSTKSLVGMYRNVIVPGVCNNQDLLGSWWEVRMAHTIPIVVINAIAILLMGFLSWKLFRVYASQSFSTVGASNLVQNMYKLVLLLSVGIQMAGFFALASAALWINKITTGHLKLIVKHENIYLALFIVFALLTLPWIVLGWRSVRKESRWQFAVFFAISVVLVVISGVMFGSALYRTLFRNWNFFATVTVTAFIFLVLTTVTAVLCRLNFGKGLAHYLQVNETLEGVDFTPVTFDKKFDTERGMPSPIGANMTQGFRPASENPFLSYDEKKRQEEQQKSPLRRGPSVFTARKSKQGDTMFLSSSPPLISDLPPVPQVPSRLIPSHTGNSGVQLPPPITTTTNDFNSVLARYNGEVRGVSLYSAVEYKSGTVDGGSTLKVVNPSPSPTTISEFQAASPVTSARPTSARPSSPATSTSTASTGMRALISRFSVNSSENNLGGGASTIAPTSPVPTIPSIATAPGLRAGDRNTVSSAVSAASPQLSMSLLKDFPVPPEPAVGHTRVKSGSSLRANGLMATMSSSGAKPWTTSSPTGSKVDENGKMWF